MPKSKTHSAAKKRFKKTANGLIKRSSAFRRHHGWAKTAKSTRDLRGTAYVHESQQKKIATLLPN